MGLGEGGWWGWERADAEVEAERGGGWRRREVEARGVLGAGGEPIGTARMPGPWTGPVTTGARWLRSRCKINK